MKQIILSQQDLNQIKDSAIRYYQTIPNQVGDNFLCLCYSLALGDFLKIDIKVKERIPHEPLD